MFLSIDGGDGTGKSTQVELLAQWLRQQGRDVVTCRDPGSTPLGEAVRNILLDRHDLHIDRRSEMLLYMAARAQMVEEVIRPALEQGKTVLCDRYLLANVAYQGYGGGLDVPTLWEVGRVATGGLMPDLTIVLDVPAGGGRRADGPAVGPDGAAGRRVSRPGARRLLGRSRPSAATRSSWSTRHAPSRKCRRRFGG